MTTNNKQNSKKNSFSYDFRARKKPITKMIKGLPVDYKDLDVLYSYVSDRAKINSAYRVGNPAKEHRSLTAAIKRARFMALLPFSHDHDSVKSSIEETKSEETKSEETKSEETKSEETKSEETKSEETKPEETKSEETKPEETKSEETKSEETKSEETKSEEA